MTTTLTALGSASLRDWRDGMEADPFSLQAWQSLARAYPGALSGIVARALRKSGLHDLTPAAELDRFGAECERAFLKVARLDEIKPLLRAIVHQGGAFPDWALPTPESESLSWPLVRFGDALEAEFLAWNPGERG